MPHLTDNIFDELISLIKGEIHTDKLRRSMLSTDGSIFKIEPSCVAYPKDRDDIVHIVKFASKYGLSIHSRGAGSGLCGSAVGNGIVLDFSKFMNKLITIDYDEKYFICEPGYRFGELEAALKNIPLFFPPDPSSGEYATFGGMFGTNASGAHSVKYGNVADYIVDAEFISGDGNVYSISELSERDYEDLPHNFKQLFDLYISSKEEIEKAYPDIKYNVCGYNLKSLVKNNSLSIGKLLAGSEGTLAVATKLKFRLLDKPLHDSLVVAYFGDIVSSARAVQDIMPLAPAGIEIMDKSLLKLAKDNDESLRDKIPDGVDNVLLIEFDDRNINECIEKANKAQEILVEKRYSDKSFLAVSEEEKENFWGVRKAAVPILYKLKGKRKILALIEDAVVPIDKLVEYFKGIYDILNKHKAEFVVYGHIAKGLMHTRPLLNLKEHHDVDLLKIIADDTFELINSLGGAISGEHGDGRLRSSYIKRSYPSIYNLFLKVKKIFDPQNIFNPEIKTVIDPYQMKKSLRYGAEYRSNDSYEKMLVWDDFVEEIEKCHGCSKCTTVTTATRMCPIYKFTRDESAAPKAKANILRALISGHIADKSLFEESFQYVIDRCVNCGSCYKECPSNVNIPKMAMEARSRYIKKFGAKFSTKLSVSAELAGRYSRKFSKLANLPMKIKSIRKMSENFTGISAEREFPSFPSKSLSDRIDSVMGNGNIKVLYFAGCYASYMRPEIGLAAIKVLNAAGVQVLVPDQHCCGLPMMTKGMADYAKIKVEENLQKWGKFIDEVDYIVVTCSSCGLSLSQEWSYLYQSDIIDKVKSKLIHISTLVNKLNLAKSLTTLPIKLSYHMPCHLKVQKDADSSIKMLKSIAGINVEDLKSHCCGMAGSWGMAASNYDLSIKIGSDMIGRLEKSTSTIGVTDCPTCRIQMEHMSKKTIKHPIEIVAECIE